MRPRVCHAPGTAGRTDATILAGKGHKNLVATGRTADAGEAVAQNAAAQVALELLGDERREVAAGVAGSVRIAALQVQRYLCRLCVVTTKRRSTTEISWLSSVCPGHSDIVCWHSGQVRSGSESSWCASV